MPVRRIPRSIYEDARDVARALAKTKAFEQSRHDRKRVEMLFAHLKRILRLGRLRLRGPRGAQMSALCQKQTSPRSIGMSALPPKADIADRQFDVRFVPKAGIRCYSITSSALASRVDGTVSPSALAALRLTDKVNLSGACTGSSPGRTPRRV
jgi:hypothetical protein